MGPSAEGSGTRERVARPSGPYLVTPDEVGDPRQIALRLSVNGVSRQNSSTANMLFLVAHVVRYLSQFMVLHPGDVINTGTPAGVALGIAGNPYLREGDVVELEIDGRERDRTQSPSPARSGATDALQKA